MSASADGYIVGPDGGFDWSAPDEVVLSRSLSSVQGNARLATGDLAEEIERLRAQARRG